MLFTLNSEVSNVYKQTYSTILNNAGAESTVQELHATVFLKVSLNITLLSFKDTITLSYNFMFLGLDRKGRKMKNLKEVKNAIQFTGKKQQEEAGIKLKSPF